MTGVSGPLIDSLYSCKGVVEHSGADLSLHDALRNRNSDYQERQSFCCFRSRYIGPAVYRHVLAPKLRLYFEEEINGQGVAAKWYWDVSREPVGSSFVLCQVSWHFSGGPAR